MKRLIVELETQLEQGASPQQLKERIAGLVREHLGDRPETEEIAFAICAMVDQLLAHRKKEEKKEL